jgi:hypothetical protein
MQTAFAGNTDTKFRDGNSEYDINIRFDAFDRNNEEDVKKIVYEIQKILKVDSFMIDVWFASETKIKACRSRQLAYRLVFRSGALCFPLAYTVKQTNRINWIAGSRFYLVRACLFQGSFFMQINPVLILQMPSVLLVQCVIQCKNILLVNV